MLSISQSPHRSEAEKFIFSIMWIGSLFQSLTLWLSLWKLTDVIYTRFRPKLMQSGKMVEVTQPEAALLPVAVLPPMSRQAWKAGRRGFRSLARSQSGEWTWAKSTDLVSVCPLKTGPQLSKQTETSTDFHDSSGQLGFAWPRLSSPQQLCFWLQQLGWPGFTCLAFFLDQDS